MSSLRRTTPHPQQAAHHRNNTFGNLSNAPLVESPTSDQANLIALQRAVGNAAIRRLVQKHAATDSSDSAGHGRGCACAACSTVSRAIGPGLVQRDGDVATAMEGEVTASLLNIRQGPGTDTTILGTYPRGTKIQIQSQVTGTDINGNNKWNKTDRGYCSDFYVKHAAAPDKKPDETPTLDPETLKKAEEMAALAAKMAIPVFIALASGVGVSLHDILQALFTYWPTVALSDIEATVKSTSADEKKGCWSDSALMTLADTKLGRDSYLTFVTQLGMHQAPTTDELSEGGKEHTAAPDADKLIREKMDKYVTGAVKAGKQIEGQVAVVGGADWDRAGIAHYGEAVWKTGPPPKTPKRDAINGFVDSQGRVWIERNSGNAGTMLHEGMHKYASDSMLNTLGFNMNEGTTEYFTRIICKDLSIDRGNYETQQKLIDSLVKATSRDIVAAAYFDGDLAGLKNAFKAYRKSKKGFFGRLFTGDATYESDWNDFVATFDAGDYTKAGKYFE